MAKLSTEELFDAFNEMTLLELSEFYVSFDIAKKVFFRIGDQLIDSSIGALQRDAILREERLGVNQQAMPELGELHDFRIQVEALAKTAQLVFGGSFLAAVAAIASLILSLSHLMSEVP